jgi:hypothetical protein
MKSFANNLVYIDNSINSIQELIKNCGKDPILPDAENGEAYTNNKLGKLGEQYIECIFKKTGIVKLQKKGKPYPDFEIFINEKNFLAEVKVISNLYKDINQLIMEIEKNVNDIDFSKKVVTLFENYIIGLYPFEVHRDHEKKFKEELEKILKNVNLSIKGKEKYFIKSNNKDYKLQFSLRKHVIKGGRFISGWSPDETTTIKNVISTHKKQIGISDILFIILLNQNIDRIDLLDFFYRQIELSMSLFVPGQSINSFSPSIIQYQYDKTIWDVRFEDEQGLLHTIDEKLKCIVVIYPSFKESLIFASIKYFDDFSSPEYFHLKEILKENGFKCALGKT